MRRKLGATQEERGTWVEGTVLLLCAHASALSTFTWVLRLKLGHQVLPSHLTTPLCPDSRMEVTAFWFKALLWLSARAACVRVQVFRCLSWIRGSIQAVFVCGYLSLGEEWLQAAPGIKSPNPACLVENWREKSSSFGAQV